MRAEPNRLSHAVAGALFASALLLTGSACQTYDFQPVTPLAISRDHQETQVKARGLHADLMLLVDRSGSMDYSDCAGCDSRLTQLKQTMDKFLVQYPKTARYGFVGYSSLNNGGACQPAKLVDISTQGVDLVLSDDDDSLASNADAVDVAVQGLTSYGGTPTAASLEMLTTYSKLTGIDPGRTKLVLLLTDGLPNCNPDNPNNQCSAANGACACTFPDASFCEFGHSQCALGCLDEDASVTAVRDLSLLGINVAVIGFGADAATSQAAEVLNEMAAAGGYARKCSTDADCAGTASGTDTCDTATSTCGIKYYQASNGEALGKALDQILVNVANPCVFALDTTVTDPNLLSVTIDGKTVATGPETWSYSPDKKQMTFVGDLCTELKNSTTANPVDLVINVINPL